MHSKIAIQVQPFRKEGVPFGIDNRKSQISDMKSEICDVKFRASARIQGHTWIDTLSSVLLVVCQLKLFGRQP